MPQDPILAHNKGPPSKNPDLVMKPFGKGSGICLMNTSLYISKIEEHLADPFHIQRTQFRPNWSHQKWSTLNYLYSITRHHLTPPKSTRTPLFYGLPKVHKPNIPLQPIVSAWQSHRSTFKLCHSLHTTSCGNIPLIYLRQQTLSTTAWISPTSVWERYFSNCWLMSHHYTQTYHMTKA